MYTYIIIYIFHIPVLALNDAATLASTGLWLREGDTEPPVTLICTALSMLQPKILYHTANDNTILRLSKNECLFGGNI